MKETNSGPTGFYVLKWPRFTKIYYLRRQINSQIKFSFQNLYSIQSDILSVLTYFDAKTDASRTPCNLCELWRLLYIARRQRVKPIGTGSIFLDFVSAGLVWQFSLLHLATSFAGSRIVPGNCFLGDKFNSFFRRCRYRDSDIVINWSWISKSPSKGWW